MTTHPTPHERATRAQELLTPVLRAVLLAAALVLCLQLAGLPGDWTLAAFAFLGTWAAYVALVAVLRQLLAPRDPRFRVVHLGPEATVNVFRLFRRLALYSAILLPPIWVLTILGYPRSDVIILLSVCHVAGLAVLALWTVYAAGGTSAFLPPQDTRSLRLARRLSGAVFPLLGAAVFALAVLKALGYLNLASYLVRVLWLNAPLLIGALIADYFIARRITAGSTGAKWTRAGLWAVVLLAQIRIWDLHYYHWRAALDLLGKPLFTVADSQISLLAILRAILLAAVTYVVARLLRDWLNRSNLIGRRYGTGIRYALASLAFYTVLISGILWAVLAGGFPLNALTVFAGMAGIGVGFGLQDIVRNFVSGVVLLIERPLAVGDFIDVGGVRGHVLGISLRSTTVRTLENVHILIPNADLMSQQVTNLSYRDLKVRLPISVGVSYESDMDQVREVLLAVAREHSSVLEDPPPRARLVGFGDSSVDFELQVWIAKPGESEVVTGELNLAVWHALKDAGIEIPFPQQDLHLRSAEALEGLVSSDKAPADEDAPPAE